MKFAVLTARLTMLMGTAAWGQEIAPPVLLAPPLSEVVGRAIDVQGLVPGMTLESARAAMMEVIGEELNERLKQTRVSEGATSVTGTPYVAKLDGGVGGDWLTVQFSGVSSDNRAVMIRRDAEYDNAATAPLLDELIGLLIEKYGKPTFRANGYEGTAMMWTYKDGTPAPCDPSGGGQRRTGILGVGSRPSAFGRELG